MNQKLTIFIMIVLSVLLFATSCSQEQKISPEGMTGFEQLSQELVGKIDRSRDSYLSGMTEKDIGELLDLYSITYGSFTESGASEILALFKAKNIPHVGGLDRTIVAVYDAHTYALISQQSFAADHVSLQLLEDANHRYHILYIGSATNQGYTTYSIDLLEAAKEAWVSKAVSPENFADNYAFAFSNNVLQVFELNYSEHTPVYDYQYTLYWDEAEAVFKKE